MSISIKNRVVLRETGYSITLPCSGPEAAAAQHPCSSGRQSAPLLSEGDQSRLTSAATVLKSVFRRPISLAALLAALACSAHGQSFFDALFNNNLFDGKAPAVTNRPPVEEIPEPKISDSPLANAGLFYDEFKLTLAPGRRTEAAGPFYYNQDIGSEHTWALPPLFSYTRDPELEMEEYNFGYPILTYHRYGGQYRWQLGQLFSFAGGPTQTETERHRFTLFPIYFQQRSSDPSENYTAYGPFYGHLKHRLMRDEIFYVMFPFYSETRKRDVVTDNYLYPIVHVRHGSGLKGWQVFPFVGHEHKDVTTRTNALFNEVETVPGHDKRFILWPVFFNDYEGLGTTNVVHNKGYIPFYSMQRSAQYDSTTVLWPFFSRIDNREKNYREWDAPWPLVEIARGPGKHTTRYWPFYSHAYNSNIVSDFVMWPVYKYNRINSAPLDRQRTRILFFLYSDVTDKNTETGASRRRVDFLPFFTHKRDLNGNTRLQVLSLLEPFLPENPNIEREYAPIYSLWRSERNGKTGATSQSLLWNLYRHETVPAARTVEAQSASAAVPAPARKKTSALFGLFQYETGPEGKRLRLFYIPILEGHPVAPQR